MWYECECGARWEDSIVFPCLHDADCPMILKRIRRQYARRMQNEMDALKFCRADYDDEYDVWIFQVIP